MEFLRYFSKRNLLRRMISLVANSYDKDTKLLNGTHKYHVHSLAEKLIEVQEFLRLPYRELTSRQVKIHRGPLSKQVENWNEVEQALKGSLYESFLHSDYFQM